MFEDVREIDNPLNGPMEVWFEPWGMPHALNPGETFRVVAVSKERGRLEVDREGSQVAVYAWPGSTMKVYRGEELVDDFSIPFPTEGMPPGLSIRDFIVDMFGGPGGPIATGRAPSRVRGPANWLRRVFRGLGGQVRGRRAR